MKAVTKEIILTKAVFYEDSYLTRDQRLIFIFLSEKTNSRGGYPEPLTLFHSLRGQSNYLSLKIIKIYIPYKWT